jgi:type I restriction enzyme S subunit
MSSDDSVIPLGELIKHKKGFAFKSKDYITSGVAVIRVSNFSDDSINPNDLKFVSGEISLTNQDVALRANDIVVATVGSWPNNPASVVGRTISVPKWADGALMNQNAVILRSKSANFHDQKFIYHQMKTLDFSTHLISKAQGSANQASITLDAIFSYPMKWPEFEHRKSIAETLSALDDRIALLRETNTTLEAIAQALFKSWFVDFDPVHAKQQGREPEGMDASTAALFPDSFEESKLGLVPMGWRVESLDKIANFLNGLALQKFPPEESNWLPVIKIAQLRKGDTNGADRANRSLKSEYIIQNGDILFSWSGSLEVEIWCGGEGALNQHLFKVTSDVYPKWFYYLWTKFHLMHFREIAESKATTMGHIQRKHLTDAKVVAPTQEFIHEANTYFEPIINRWIANSLKAKNLESIRDTLLPRLISGQLRLPDSAPA